MRRLKIILSIFFLIVSICIVIYFTFQNSTDTIKSTQIVQKVMVEVTLKVNRSAVNSQFILNKQLIRKAAHIAEYFVVGVAMANLWFVLRKKTMMRLPLTFCFLVSICDQMLKGILPYREFDFFDLPLDFLGYLIGVYFYVVIIKLYRTIKSKNSQFIDRTFHFK